jgi:hypothetical protein
MLCSQRFDHCCMLFSQRFIHPLLYVVFITFLPLLCYFHSALVTVISCSTKLLNFDFWAIWFYLFLEIKRRFGGKYIFFPFFDCRLFGLGWFLVLNATFNTISVISWRSVILVEETEESHLPVASHWQTLSRIL